MNLELFKYDHHYPVVSQWLEKYGWPEMDRYTMPTYGLIASDGDKYLCVGFFYRTDSKIGLIEWMIGNPDIDHELRAQGIKAVVQALLRHAKKEGFEFIFSFVRNKRLLDKYKETGFEITDEGMTHGVWRI